MDLQNALKWLEISKIEGLDLASLKKKYRKLTLRYHPDKGGKTADFIKLQAAYNFLQDCIKYPHAHKANQESTKSHRSNSQDYSQSQSTASDDIEFYKRQIEQLQKSITNYQNLINSQIRIIKHFYNNLDHINSQSNKYNTNLGELLDLELAKLNKKYKSDWWKGFVGFKTMDKSDLVYYQNQLINEHNRLLSTSQKDNQQARYKAYQQVVSEIVQGINSLS
jgi:chromosome segregation ATPase